MADGRTGEGGGGGNSTGWMGVSRWGRERLQDLKLLVRKLDRTFGAADLALWVPLSFPILLILRTLDVPIWSTINSFNCHTHKNFLLYSLF